MDFGFFDSVLQGLTLGFSDEIGSAIATGGVSGPEYERQMAEFAREDFEEENPGMALTGEILGGLAPGLLTGGAGFLTGGRTALRREERWAWADFRNRGGSWCRHRSSSRSRDCGSGERGAGQD